ncbi:hypothetical protein [Amycolatopsis eburnea]|uniref:Uncharacterized protein n=1 Tax=Amycolatopsis eburnea TaxID=2267691 RepID=A0A427TFP1_9PSEU|nr:hypothetical protein [Amycolatopsis eburnea]RSD21967.1 hypothetical protein EIY87_09120 [Amycolatopsis eburnea]
MSATTVLLTLPGDVVRNAVRAMVQLGAAAVTVPALLGSAGTLGDYLKTYEAVAHENEPHACPWCQHRGHVVRWRAYPVLDPGPCPPGDVLTDLVEACWCCLWGTGPGPQRLAEPLMDRLQREAFDGRDVHVEHLDRDGRWTKFETRF